MEAPLWPPNGSSAPPSRILWRERSSAAPSASLGDTRWNLTSLVRGEQNIALRHDARRLIPDHRRMVGARTGKRQRIRTRDRSCPAPGRHPLLRVHTGERDESPDRRRARCPATTRRLMRVLRVRSIETPVARAISIKRSRVRVLEAHLRKAVIRVDDAHARAHLDDARLARGRSGLPRPAPTGRSRGAEAARGF